MANVQPHEAARHFLEAGRSVIPIRQGTKGEPLVAWKPYAERPPTVEEFEGWVERWPDASYALVTGRVSRTVVVDVDVERREGESQAEFWERVEQGDEDARERLEDARRRMESIRERWPTDWVHRSGGGGYQLFYRYSVDGPVQNRTDVGGRKVDIRGDGGYVVLPPALHPVGNRYEALESGEAGPEIPPFALGDAPESVQGDGKSPDWAVEAFRGVRIRKRHDTLLRLVGKLESRGVPPREAYEILLGWNERNEPPIGEHPDDELSAEEEIGRAVRDIYRKERRGRASEAGLTEIRLMSHREYGAKYSTGEGMDWRVRDWLPKLGFGTAVGPPETYKSWILYDLAFSVASGMDFLGQFPVAELGPVIIFQLEDSNESVMSRLNLIEWFRRGYRVPPESDDPSVLTGPLPLDLPLYHFPEFGLDLKPRTIDLLSEQILEVGAKLVIFDPLFTLGDREDEFFRQMAHEIQPLKHRQEELGCAFIFGHHTTKNEEAVNSTSRQRTYGSQFLDASKNFDWQVRKVGNDAVALKRYFKNAATIDEVGIRFDINTDPEHGRTVYDVAVKGKRGRGPYGRPPIREMDVRSDHAIRLAIYEHVAAHPGESWREIREALGVRKESIRHHRDWLEGEGHIENQGTDSHHAWYPGDEPYLPGMGPGEGDQ